MKPYEGQHFTSDDVNQLSNQRETKRQHQETIPRQQSQPDLPDGDGPRAVAGAASAFKGLRGRDTQPLSADTTDARHRPRQYEAGG